MTLAVTLRSARPAERGALEALQRRASLHWEDDRQALLDHPDAIELPLEQITGGQTIVAEGVAGVLGFAVVLRRDDRDGELDGLFVEPAHWRRGIGRALVEAAATLARSDGAASLWVVANPRALPFYAALGFVPSGVVQTRFRPAPRLRLRLLT